MSWVSTPSLRVVEDDDPHGAAQPPKRPLVQFGPDLRARPVDQQPDSLARVAQGQDEEPCPPVFAGGGVTDHRSVPVIGLTLFTRGRGDDRPGLDGGLLPEGRDEAPHARIGRWEAMVIDQVLARWPWRCAPGRAPRRPVRGRARRRSPAAHDRDGLWPRQWRLPCRCRPRAPPTSRWAPPPKWPVLTAECEAGHGPAPPARRPSGTR